MQPLVYSRARDLGDAVALGVQPGARLVAGGTTLVDLMRLGIERPERVVDLQSLDARKLEAGAFGAKIGALVTNADLARHPDIVARYPALSQAILSGASPQVRNMASTAGNLLQRTRCSYFRDADTPCNKKVAGAGCPALDGYNRGHAILGGSNHCIATHPSDMCVALVAFDATVSLHGPQGDRKSALIDLYLEPGDDPRRETTLAAGEVITAVELPATPFFARSAYLKVRDRASFAFALVSTAAALDIENGKITAARVALGGVATRPWRSREAEHELIGQPPTPETFARAGKAAVRGAQPRAHNQFKVTLAERVVARALSMALGGAA